MEGFNKDKSMCGTLYYCTKYVLPPSSLSQEDYARTLMFLGPKSWSREWLSTQGGLVPQSISIWPRGKMWRKDLLEAKPRAMENNGLDNYCTGRTRTYSRNVFQCHGQGPGHVYWRNFSIAMGQWLWWTSNSFPFQKGVGIMFILSLIPLQFIHLQIKRSHM